MNDDLFESLYGFIAGLVVGTVGAWKDTLFEDFEWSKFFRSAIITEIWYLILRQKYRDPLALVLLSSIALERLTVEIYKALDGQPPGKFASPTKDRGWFVKRVS